MRKKLVSFACSDNADDEPWHQQRASELMEEYNDWFEATEFIYDKDYRYIQAYSKTKKDYTPTRFYVYCLLYTSPSPRDKRQSRMPSSA